MSLTLAIIKPDAVASRNVGRILTALEDEGFVLKAAKLLQLEEEQAGEFYAVHSQQPFYEPLRKFMTSGPILALALERDQAVDHLRRVIGATDPAEAAPGTIRALYAKSKERNAIHASDSEETARQELSFFFAPEELIGTQ